MSVMLWCSSNIFWGLIRAENNLTNLGGYNMRNILVILMLIMSIAFGQAYVIVEEDSVEFGMLNLNRNCGAMFVMDVELVDRTFTIVAIDSGDMATCGSCNFDVEVVVGGLESGNYFAHFYSYDINGMVDTDSTWEYTRDSTYVGEAEFSIMSPPLVPYSILSRYQSPCSHGMAINEEIHPDQLTLVQNYPNPFNNTTHIEFILPYDDFWKASIYNLEGVEISTLAAGQLVAGFHEIAWQAEGVPSGVYLIKIFSSTSGSTAKMLLLK